MNKPSAKLRFGLAFNRRRDLRKIHWQETFVFYTDGALLVPEGAVVSASLEILKATKDLAFLLEDSYSPAEISPFALFDEAGVCQLVLAGNLVYLYDRAYIGQAIDAAISPHGVGRFSHHGMTWYASPSSPGSFIMEEFSRLQAGKLVDPLAP